MRRWGGRLRATALQCAKNEKRPTSRLLSRQSTTLAPSGSTWRSADPSCTARPLRPLAFPQAALQSVATLLFAMTAVLRPGDGSVHHVEHSLRLQEAGSVQTDPRGADPSPAPHPAQARNGRTLSGAVPVHPDAETESKARCVTNSSRAQWLSP